MKDLLKICCSIALNRGKITQEDLLLPDATKFLDAAQNELYEARECVRKLQYKTFVENGKPEGLFTELSDVIITLFTMAECFGIDLETEIKNKIEYNKIRND